ncbi:uncharacterized protein LAESUDRAFT_654694 [Laetiporus sulphureus 93-53]|uniref:Glycosyltransferase family 32 protein n=1 Tax=Laetiporus sulphureus 93-53 TaxID=1314785 RepID=A0A165DYD8_9APHY|nr:uncharacterized protein LAESUDRAFT_654694 [Laetiporus sulphureus 93-53]KZT05870.1 hypothetical protein LAESUDRAFT_654694 [Laetiporus sulphureus 93-53]
MASSVYFQQNGNGYAERTRFNGLPTHSTAVREKWHRHHPTSSWFIPLSLPIPGVRTRRLRLMAPNPARLHQFSVTRFGRRRGPLILCMGLFIMVFTVFAFHKRFATEEKKWPLSSGESGTLVYRPEDLQRIWEWEIAAGHYPSSRKLPKQIGMTTPPLNPALPARKSANIPSRYRSPIITNTIGNGAKRVYLDIQASPPNVAYPPRPVPGSVADMDVIMEHCDFSANKYVRDCLEVLRIGAGLDNQARLRRGKMDDWKYIYIEDGESENITEPDAMLKPNYASLKTQGESELNNDFSKKRGVDWEPHLNLSPPPKYRPYKDQPMPCDNENPRIFHLFWAGDFTDKPYLALLSFLFTQNLGLHLDDDHQDPYVCRPKFWVWINPGPAAAIPNPSAMREMFDKLKSNPWASPFLHPRFKDVIQFKLWNTTEQLDGIPELKDEWRSLRDTLFNSGGFVEKVQIQEQDDTVDEVAGENGEDGEGATVAAAPAPTKGKDDKFNRVGSTSAAAYDRLSVILSDMARFVLCHRFGGIYLDADTIFLRDWEELWGWRGAFAYRWSRLETYNTAVLHMNKGSALGTFLFRTALKNRLDFHPMTIAKYTKDAYTEGLLLRLPDALFDSAWLNTEYWQRDRPPQPYLTEFRHFFEAPRDQSAAPAALGFDGFFKGAYSYHFHNFWWLPFDPLRNWPDLGERFISGERIARAAAAAESGTVIPDQEDDVVANDKRDLDWATVLKRTFEAYIRGERPNMYGEWLKW